MLKIQFLGTGTSQGIPVIGSDHPVSKSNDPKDKRLRTSALLTKNGKNVIIDCGPDFRYQMLRAGANTLEAILFTHEHNDHVLGIDDTRSLSFFAQKPMDIYADENTIKSLVDRFPYAFGDNKYPGAPSLNIHHLNEKKFEVAGFEVDTLEVMHGKLPIVGYLIDKKLAYITDASYLPDDTLNKIKDIPVLVLNALRKNMPHHSHYTLEEAVEVSKSVNAGKTYFIHISERMGFHSETQKELPSNMYLAYDTLEIEI